MNHVNATALGNITAMWMNARVGFLIATFTVVVNGWQSKENENTWSSPKITIMVMLHSFVI